MPVKNRTRRYVAGLIAAAFFFALFLISLFPFGVVVTGRAAERWFHLYDERDYEEFLTETRTSPNCMEGVTVVLHTDVYLDRKAEDANAMGGRFWGVFEGNGHAIIGLKVSEIEGEEGAAWMREIGKNGIVKNLDFFDVELSHSVSAATIALNNFGEISSVRVSGTISAKDAGGLVLHNYGTISACDSLVKFSATGNYGGLALSNQTSYQPEDTGDPIPCEGEITDSFSVAEKAIYSDSGTYSSADGYRNGAFESDRVVRDRMDAEALLLLEPLMGEFKQAGDLDLWGTPFELPERVTLDGRGYGWYHASAGMEEDFLLLDEKELVFEAVTAVGAEAEAIGWTGTGSIEDPFLIDGAEKFAAYLAGIYPVADEPDLSEADFSVYYYPQIYFRLTCAISGDFSGIEGERKARHDTVLEGEGNAVSVPHTLFDEIEGSASEIRTVEQHTGDGETTQKRITMYHRTAEVNRLVVRATEGQAGVFAANFNGKGSGLSLYGTGGSALTANYLGSDAVIENLYAEGRGEYGVNSTGSGTLKFAWIRVKNAQDETCALSGGRTSGYAKVLTNAAQNETTRNVLFIDDDGIIQAGTLLDYLPNILEDDGWTYASPSLQFAALKGETKNRIVLPFPWLRQSAYKKVTLPPSSIPSEAQEEIFDYERTASEIEVKRHASVSELENLVETGGGRVIERGSSSLSAYVGDCYHVAGVWSFSLLGEVFDDYLDILAREENDAESDAAVARNYRWSIEEQPGFEREIDEREALSLGSVYVARQGERTGESFYARVTPTEEGANVSVKTYCYAGNYSLERMENYWLNEVLSSETCPSLQDQLEKQWFKDGVLYSQPTASSPGTYILRLSVEADEDSTGWICELVYNIRAGSAVDSPAALYRNSFPSTLSFIYNAQSLSLSSVRPSEGLFGSASYQIKRYPYGGGGVGVPTSEIREVGRYLLSITYTDERFLPQGTPIEVWITVDYREVEAGITVKATYGEPLEIEYRFDGDALAQSEIDPKGFAASGRYTTNYAPGDDVGWYTFTLFSQISGNFRIREKTVEFEVLSAKFNLESVKIETPDGAVYDGKYHVVTYSGLPEGAQVEEFFELKGVLLVPDAHGLIDAGTYTYRLKLSKENYETEVIVRQFTIDPLSVKVELLFPEIVYNAAMPAYEVRFSPELPARADEKQYELGTLEISCNYQRGDPVGNYPVTVTRKYEGGTNLVFDYIPVSLYVTKATPQIYLLNDATSYSGEEYVPHLTGNLGEGDVYRLKYFFNDAELKGAPSGVGEYRLHLSLDETDNYSGAEFDFSFSITAIPIPKGSWQSAGGISQREYNAETTTLGYLPAGSVREEIATEYRWKLNGKEESGKEGILLLHAGRYTEMRVTLSPTVRDPITGEYNYLSNSFDYGVSSITVSPRSLLLQDPEPLDYLGKPLMPSLRFRDEDLICEGDEVGFVFEGDTGGFIDVGSYSFTVSSDNSDYVISNPAVHFDIKKATVEITFDDIVRTYGDNAYERFRYTVKYRLGGEGREAQAILYATESGRDTLLNADKYRILKALPISGSNEERNLDFILSPDAGSYIVKPRPIRIDYGLEESYVYTGEEVVVAGTRFVEENTLSSQKPTNTPVGAQIIVPSAVACGSYEASVTLNNPNYIAQNPKVSFEITPCPVRLVGNIARIFYLDSVSVEELVVVEGKPEKGEELRYTITCAFYPGVDVATYPVEISYRDEENPNYTISTFNGAVIVSPIPFPALSLPAEFSLVYTGEPAALFPMDSAFPEGGSAEWDQPYIEAGVYPNAQVILTHKNYATKRVEVYLTIEKGTPNVRISEIGVRNGNAERVLETAELKIEASFRGTAIEGSVYFRIGEELLQSVSLAYGTNALSVLFRPENRNLNEIEHSFVVELLPDETEVKLELPVREEGGAFEGAEGEIKLQWDAEEILPEGEVLSLYVNGDLVAEGRTAEYTFGESMQGARVELKWGNHTIWSDEIDVEIGASSPPPSGEETPPGETEEKDPNDQEESAPPQAGNLTSISKGDKRASVGLYLGLGIGGLAILGIGIAVTVLVIKRKREED